MKAFSKMGPLVAMALLAGAAMASERPGRVLQSGQHGGFGRVEQLRPQLWSRVRELRQRHHGRQHGLDSDRISDLALAFDDVLSANVDVQATRTGSLLCGPALATATFAADYATGPSNLTIDP